MTTNFKLHTPTGTPFTCTIDKEQELILITSEAGNTHAYHLQAIKDLFHWLRNDKKGGWVLLGSRGEEEQPNEDTVEQWARCAENPIQGFYGVTPGRRGRFASYVPAVLEYLGLAEVEHNPRNNRMRAQP